MQSTPLEKCPTAPGKVCMLCDAHTLTPTVNDRTDLKNSKRYLIEEKKKVGKVLLNPQTKSDLSTVILEHMQSKVILTKGVSISECNLRTKVSTVYCFLTT